MSQHDDLICVGHILGSQGLKGQVRVFSNTSPRENIVSYGPWFVEQGNELKVMSVTGRLQGKNVIARLEGIEDRTGADELSGCRIFIEPEQLPSLEAGEYYWSDLVGLSVETLEGDPLGEVASMMETGANDVMVLTGERERLIPFVMDQIVREVDLVNRRLVVDWSPSTEMRIDVITLFPELVEQVISCGVVGRAAEQKLLELCCWNPRDYTRDKHRTVDDRPYGGGPGMLMKVQPLQDAIGAAREQNPDARLVYLSPQGELLNQQKLARQVELGSVIFLCGRYEGIDERLIQREVDEEWSIGDYVISGGELAAMVCIDAMTRLIPGALGHEDSAQQDSFSAGLLDYPHYTRPENYLGDSVPEVLLNGNHREIDAWREQQALGRTWQRRPDLLQQVRLDSRQQALLDAYISEAERTRKR